MPKRIAVSSMKSPTKLGNFAEKSAVAGALLDPMVNNTIWRSKNASAACVNSPAVSIR